MRILSVGRLLRFVAVMLVLLSTPLTHPTAASGVDADLAVVQEAYDLLDAHLYTAPDTRALLIDAYAQAEAVLGVQAPLDDLIGDPASQWDGFARAVRNLAISSTNLPGSGDLRTRLLRSFATTVDDPHTYYLSPQAVASRRAVSGGNNTVV